MASILVVCTGNICRSPMAEGFLRRTLQERLGGDAPTVCSAGTWGWEDSPAVPESISAASERGTDIRAHRGSRLEPELVIPAFLVIGMTAEHRDAVEAMVPHAASRSFTLKELDRLLEALPPLGDAAESMEARVAAADELRRSGFEGNPDDEDIVDPMGTPIETFRAVAWEIDTLCQRLVDGLIGRSVALLEQEAEA